MGKREISEIEKQEEDLWKSGFADRMNDLVARYKDDEGNIPYSTLADEIGIDVKLLRNYLEGKNVPTATKLMKIADFFGVTMDYLAFGWRVDLRFTASTIVQLAVLVRDCRISHNPKDSTPEKLSIHVEDKHLTMILKELLLSKNCSDYNKVISTLCRVYNGFCGYRGELVDYAAFHNLVRQEYRYQDIDPNTIFYFEDGSEGLQGYDFDYLVERSQEWDEMTEFERETWWERYSAEEYDKAEEISEAVRKRLAANEYFDPEENEEYDEYYEED